MTDAATVGKVGDAKVADFVRILAVGPRRRTCPQAVDQGDRIRTPGFAAAYCVTDRGIWYAVPRLKGFSVPAAGEASFSPVPRATRGEAIAPGVRTESLDLGGVPEDLSAIASYRASALSPHDADDARFKGVYAAGLIRAPAEDASTGVSIPADFVYKPAPAVDPYASLILGGDMPSGFATLVAQWVDVLDPYRPSSQAALTSGDPTLEQVPTLAVPSTQNGVAESFRA